ncbi:MAG: hypothetical protein GY845_16505 [Planctomycetes bacterium]|nr:hypothetical protein [Planctomycetota bacterium]
MEGDKNFGNILFLFFGMRVFERKWAAILPVLTQNKAQGRGGPLDEIGGCPYFFYLHFAS